MQNLLDFLVQTLFGELIVVVIGVLLAQLVHLTWDRWRFGGWTVSIVQNNANILEEEIPSAKAKEILADPISLRIYLKGLVSAYSWLNCDLLTKGKDIGLFTEDHEKRRFVIDLDKNPTQ